MNRKTFFRVLTAGSALIGLSACDLIAPAEDDSSSGGNPVGYDSIQAPLIVDDVVDSLYDALDGELSPQTMTADGVDIAISESGLTITGTGDDGIHGTVNYSLTAEMDSYVFVGDSIDKELTVDGVFTLEGYYDTSSLAWRFSGSFDVSSDTQSGEFTMDVGVDDQGFDNGDFTIDGQEDETSIGLPSGRSRMVFWLNSTSTAPLPVDVYIDGQFEGRITAIHQSRPPLGTRGTVAVVVDAGDVTYRADSIGLGGDWGPQDETLQERSQYNVGLPYP